MNVEIAPIAKVSSAPRRSSRARNLFVLSLVQLAVMGWIGMHVQSQPSAGHHMTASAPATSAVLASR